MIFLQKTKGLVRKLIKSLGYDIQKSIDIPQVKKIKNIAKRFNAAQELVHKYPNHPLSHLELAACLHTMSDPHQFEQIDRYGEVRRKWLINTGFEELDIEIIWLGMFVGSLGNPFAIESLLKANQLGLRTARKPVLLLPQTARLRNPALFSYFEPHLSVIRDEEAIHSLKRMESILTLPLSLCLPLHEGYLFQDFAANRVEVERKDQGVDAALFKLSDNHREMGMQALEELGLPKDAWYVTLHVREPGYRGETHANTIQNWRNANPLDYVKAIEAVTNAGGWVFRMGDPSMTPLPSMPQVIDYVHHRIRSDWMDVFLGATCRFLIGTGSGYLHIPMFFGVPCILTNFPGFIPYFGLKNYDLYLPRWIKNAQTNNLISFDQFMSPPTSMFYSLERYSKAGLQWVENTPEELEGATQEMLERTANGTSSQYPDDDLQRRFKAIAEECGLKHGGRPVKAFAPISQDFLMRHADLLGGAL